MIMVKPLCFKIFKISARIRIELKSRLDEGSSRTIILGLKVKIEAIAIFCFCPFERLSSFSVKRFSICKMEQTSAILSIISSREIP